MAVKYLAEVVAQPNQMACWAAAFLMLERWVCARAGRFREMSELEHLVGIASTKATRSSVAGLAWPQVQPLCRKYGFAWKYIPAEPWAFEKCLSATGPFVYVNSLTNNVVPWVVEDVAMRP